MAAIRSLARSPSSSLLVIATLAVGLGASTAMFSVVDAVILRPRPYGEPDRLLYVTERDPHGEGMNFSYPDFLDFRGRARTIASWSLFKTDTYVLGGAGEPRQIRAGLVSAAYFTTLQVPLA